MIRILLAISLFVASFSLRADRVRVVVALAEPEIRSAMLSGGKLRATLLESLSTATEVEPWGSGRVFAAEIDRSELELLRLDPRVRAVSIDEGGQGALAQSLPLIGVPVVRAQGWDGTGVTVAVLDTGIDRTNRDFEGRIVAEQCFCNNGLAGCCPDGSSEQSGPGAAMDDHGHGTHVAGIVGGAGVNSPAGVAPKVKIVAVKVMDSQNRFASFTQIYRGLEWILVHRPDVRVINMSLGSFARFSSADCQSAAIALGMKGVVADLRARGVLITASSGNEGDAQHVVLPACMTEVLGIGAVYDTPGGPVSCSAQNAQVDQVTCFTNSNESIDLLAPGETIVASRLGGGMTTFTGTSMAAPHVAGGIALMQQVSAGRISSRDTEEILKLTGKPVVDGRNGLSFVRIDLAGAIAATPRSSGTRRRSAGH